VSTSTAVFAHKALSPAWTDLRRVRTVAAQEKLAHSVRQMSKVQPGGLPTVQTYTPDVAKQGP